MEQLQDVIDDPDPDEEDARQNMVALEILVNYLSHQWLPRDVQTAYDHMVKSMGQES